MTYRQIYNRFSSCFIVKLSVDFDKQATSGLGIWRSCFRNYKGSDNIVISLKHVPFPSPKCERLFFIDSWFEMHML